jgi:DNA end-binding protein Ku
MFPAVEAKSEIRFHQLSRKTGERVRHQKVAGDADGDGAPIEKDEIVKGYEYRKGEYVVIEPSEIEGLRIPSRHTLAVTQCVDLDELDPELFEKPYFVTPDGDNQTEAFSVVREALRATRRAALGKIAFAGREHLIALAAPANSGEDSAGGRGMMAYTLRYAEELRDASGYFSGIRKTVIDEEQLSLAKELIQRKAARFAPEKFHDEYEAALKAMVEAKVNHAPVPKDEPAPRAGKVVNLMDALRKSVRPEASGDGESATARKRPAKSGGVVASETKKGPSLVKPVAKAARTRRSA